MEIQMIINMALFLGVFIYYIVLISTRYVDIYLLIIPFLTFLSYYAFKMMQPGGSIHNTIFYILLVLVLFFCVWASISPKSLALASILLVDVWLFYTMYKNFKI